MVVLRDAYVSWIILSTYATVVKPSKPDLYYFLLSPPSRTVLMTASVLNLDINLKALDVSKGEQFTPAYLEINPQHTVPALNDNGLKISESRAIAAYLTTLTPNGERLYPRDPRKRAVVDQMMYFDLDKMYTRMLKFFVIDPDATPMIFGAPYDRVKSDRLGEAFSILEKYLTKNTWAAGGDMTIADITLLTTVSMAEGCGYDVSRYPKVKKWLVKMKTQIPEYKALNDDGIQLWINVSKLIRPR